MDRLRALLSQIKEGNAFAKWCYTCNSVASLTPRGEAMKYHAGDRVRLVSFNKEATILNTEGSKLHPFYVKSDDGTIEDYFMELDIEPSKIPVLNDAAIDRILLALKVSGDLHTMRSIVRQAVSLAPALPERRELPDRETRINKTICDDANLFEAIIGFHPERRNTSAYPWGWCYVSETVQKQFQDYCNGPKSHPLKT